MELVNITFASDGPTKGKRGRGKQDKEKRTQERLGELRLLFSVESAAGKHNACGASGSR